GGRGGVGGGGRFFGELGGGGVGFFFFFFFDWSVGDLNVPGEIQIGLAFEILIPVVGPTGKRRQVKLPNRVHNQIACFGAYGFCRHEQRQAVVPVFSG